MKGGIFIASSLFAVVAGVVHAEDRSGPDNRQKTVASQYYVDTELDTLKAKTINGIELGTGGYFFANEASTDTEETCAKTLDGNDITLQELNAGQIITVKPRYTSHCGNNTVLSLRVPLDGQAQLTGPAILYNGTPVRGATQTLVWTENVPSTFVYDGTNWLFMGHGVDIDTDTNTVPAYGTSDTGASATIKSVTVPTGTELVSGQIITIKPTTTTSANTLFISLDSGITGKKVRYNGSDIGNVDTAAKVWNADYVSTFMYDGTAWNFIASTKDTSADLASLASHTVNGAPLSNAASYFYGTSSTAAGTPAKTVTISSIADAPLATGQIITVKPTETSTASDSYTLQLNPGDSSSREFGIYYNGAGVKDAATGALIWNQNYPSTFVYDGTNWVFLGHGVDNSIGYAHSPTVATTPTKAVSIPSITSLSTGQMITVWPEHTSSADNQTHKIKLNSLAAKDIFYKGTVVSALDDGQAVWNAGYPSTFVYDAAANSGNGAWVFVSKGYDANQTYSTLVWSNTQGTAIDAYNTTFGSGANNWAGNDSNLITGKFLANALARKQNNITAADADPWNDSTTLFPALVSNTASGGINGNAYGVIDQATITDNNWSLGYFTNNNNATATDKLIPTVRAVATWLTSLLPTGTAGSAVIYNGTNSDGVPQFTEREIFTGGEPQYTANYADSLPTAQYVHSKQNHVPATDVQYISNAAATQTNPLTAVRQKADGAVFIPYQNGGNGEIGQRGVAVEYAEYTENGQTYNNDGWIATIGAARKIATAALPTGDSGKAVTYNSNGKIGGSATISSAATYDNGVLQNGSDIANITAVETKQNKISGTLGNVVTYTGTAGTLGSLGVYNGTGTYGATNLATAGFVNTKQGLINAVSTNAHTEPLLAPVVTYPTSTDGAVTQSLVAGNFPTGNATMLVVGETTANAMRWFDGTDKEDNVYLKELQTLDENYKLTDIENALVSLKFASGMYQDIQKNMTSLSGNTVNGAPLSNSASYFYGTETGTASSAIKTVEAGSITSAPTAGMFLIVQPAAQNSAQLSPGNAGTALQMKLNNNDPKPLHYNNAPITDSSVANKVWSPNFPSIWVYQGSGSTAHWEFVAKGYDENTTYDTLTWTANNEQQDALNAYSITFGNSNNDWFSNSGNGTELVNGVFLVNALALKQNIIPAGTPGNVVTYTDTVGSVGSATVSSTATYNNNGVLQNGSDIATIAAVEANKITCYQYETNHDGDDNYCLLWQVPN